MDFDSDFVKGIFISLNSMAIGYTISNHDYNKILNDCIFFPPKILKIVLVLKFLADLR